MGSTSNTQAVGGGLFSHIDGLSILSGVLGIVSIAYPPAAPIIGILERVAPYIIAAKPLIAAAIAEGPGAFDAAKKAAPELGKAISDLASHLMPSGAFGSDPKVVLENVARAVFGHSQMTFEQQMKWMNDTTPGNDPSQENSQRGSG